MKKISYLMIVSSLLGSSTAMAKESIPQVVTERPVQEMQSALRNNTDSKQLRKSSSHRALSPRKVTPIPVGKYGDVIYTAPEGKVETLARSGSCYYPFWGGLYSGPYNNVMGEIVTVDDNDVYLKDPISMYGNNSYLKGYKDGDKLIFELPQPVMVDEYYDCDILVTLLQYAEDEEGGWFYPANTEVSRELNLPDIDNILEINIEEDGSYSYTSEDNIVLGLIYGDDLSWTGNAELESVWQEFDDKPIDVPSDLKTEQVAVRYGEIGNFASIGFDGNDVYIKGLFAEMPEAWVKGTRNGDKITFESGQYLGPNYVYNYFTYFTVGKFMPAWDEEFEEWYDILEPQDQIIFDFNEEQMILTCAEDEAVICNTSKTEISSICYYVSPVIMRQAEDISNIPSNPYDLYFESDFEDYGFNYFLFNLPQLNETGDLLDTANLYYKIYVDGDEFEFMTDDYLGLEKDMTLIPYTFIDSYGDFEYSGTTHGVYFYFEGAEEIGVQLLNIKDGKLLGESEIVSISTDPAGIEEIGVTDGKSIEDVRIYNINGQEVSDSANGILIRTVRYSDGSRKAFKVVKR